MSTCRPRAKASQAHTIITIPSEITSQSDSRRRPPCSWLGPAVRAGVQATQGQTAFYTPYSLHLNLWPLEGGSEESARVKE